MIVSSMNVDGTGLVTAVRTTGADTVVSIVDESRHVQYPRLDAVESFTDIVGGATLGAHAQRRMLRGSKPIRTITADILRISAGAFIVGDIVTVSGGHGLVSLDGRWRIVAINISVKGASDTLVVTLVEWARCFLVFVLQEKAVQNES